MSIKIGIDNKVIELTGEEAAKFEAQRAEDQKFFEDNEIAAKNKLLAKSELLNRLGITEKEVKLLLA